FHLWTADVYEGSPIAITAYLSVISKGAISFVFLTALYSMFAPMAHTWYLIISILAIATLFVGNLFAIRQDNIKRFLAFSSIAQVGFILVGITSNSPMGTSSVIYFILIYLFSNLGAFGVIALVSQKTGKERISDYRGFYKNNRLLAWVLTISLFSLAGIPPTAGFFGKFFLLLAGANSGNYFLISMAAINMIISLYYYLRIVRAIFMDTEADGMEKVETGLIPGFGMAICLAGIILSGLLGGCYTYISSIAG
ncbi:MAG: proton-conducting transporter membrane subunit, partial [Chitinophagales bacterium]